MLTVSMILVFVAAVSSQSQAPPGPVMPVGGRSEFRQDAPDPPACVASAQWLTDTQLNVSRASVQPLTLFTAVSRGPNCPAVVLLRVAYFDEAGVIVCGGAVELRVPHGGQVMYTNIEVRPGNVYEFVRWLNGPRASSQQWWRVSCLTPDGEAEVQPALLERAQSLRLHAIVLPANSGLATAELRMRLRP